MKTNTFAAVWLFVAIVRGQENAQTRIPDSLTECYNTPEMYNRDTRLPATIGTLIDLVRKVEDNSGYVQDIRQITTSLLHRFKQDGIERAPGVFQKSVLPFSPSGHQFSKHRLLLSRLIPGNANNFPNSSLTVGERVSIDRWATIVSEPSLGRIQCENAIFRCSVHCIFSYRTQSMPKSEATKPPDAVNWHNFARCESPPTRACTRDTDVPPQRRTIIWVTWK